MRALRAVDVRRLAAGKGHGTLAKNKQQKEQKGGVVQTRADMVLHRLRQGRVPPCVTNGEATATVCKGSRRRLAIRGEHCDGGQVVVAETQIVSEARTGVRWGSLRGYKQVLLKGVVAVVVTRAMDRQSWFADVVSIRTCAKKKCLFLVFVGFGDGSNRRDHGTRLVSQTPFLFCV